MIFRRRRTAPMTITTCDVMFFLANKKQMAFLSFFLFYEHFIVRSLYSNPVDMAASIAKPSFKYNYAKRFDFFIITFLFIPVHFCSSVCFFFSIPQNQKYDSTPKRRDFIFNIYFLKILFIC